MLGELLAPPTFVYDDSTTTSATPVLLSSVTKDRVTITIAPPDVNVDVMVEFVADVYGELGGHNLGMSIYIDGVLQVSSVVTPAGALQPQTAGVRIVRGLSVGTWPIEVRVNVAAGEVGHWKNRLLKVTRAS